MSNPNPLAYNLEALERINAQEDERERRKAAMCAGDCGERGDCETFDEDDCCTTCGKYDAEAADMARHGDGPDYEAMMERADPPEDSYLDSAYEDRYESGLYGGE